MSYANIRPFRVRDLNMCRFCYILRHGGMDFCPGSNSPGERGMAICISCAIRSRVPIFFLVWRTPFNDIKTSVRKVMFMRYGRLE